MARLGRLFLVAGALARARALLAARATRPACRLVLDAERRGALASLGALGALGAFGGGARAREPRRRDGPAPYGETDPVWSAFPPNARAYAASTPPNAFQYGEITARGLGVFDPYYAPSKGFLDLGSGDANALLLFRARHPDAPALTGIELVP